MKSNQHIPQTAIYQRVKQRGQTLTSQQTGKKKRPIDTLHNQVMMYDGRLAEMEENYSMDDNYIMGLHYAVVEAGGFVRFPMGVEAPYLVPMGIQERGNVLAHSTMGAASYMEQVLQCSRAAPGEATDLAMDTSSATGESESGIDDADVEKQSNAEST